MYRPHARSGKGANMRSSVAPGSGRSTFSADRGGGEIRIPLFNNLKVKTSKKSVCAMLSSCWSFTPAAEGAKISLMASTSRSARLWVKRGPSHIGQARQSSTEPPRLGRTVLVLCQCLPVQIFVLPSVKWISECEWDSSTIQTVEHASK
jgi:hypothetical protein